MVAGPEYLEANARSLERLRALIERLTDEQLGIMVNERWTVADSLGHMAFWDGRAFELGGKVERGEPSTSSDDEPEDVDWINDAAWPLIHAIPPRDVAALALRIAEETDRRMASLPPERVYPGDPESPVNARRADHRDEHLALIEEALGAKQPPSAS